MEDAYAPFYDLSVWLMVAAFAVIMALLWTMMNDKTGTGHGDGDSDGDGFSDSEGPQ